jgi:hypothetical protein
VLEMLVSIEGPDGGVDITGATPVVFSCTAVSKEEFAISDITYFIELKLLYIFQSRLALEQIV